ncbi:MAG: hypothetical protein ACOX22_02685 [Caldicoprobacterales bacterium]
MSSRQTLRATRQSSECSLSPVEACIIENDWDDYLKELNAMGS